MSRGDRITTRSGNGTPELVERHHLVRRCPAGVVDAFARGEVEKALALASPEMGERLSIAGNPEDWIERIRTDVAPHGYNHMALVDPYLVESWSGRRLSRLPDLASRLELFAAEVVPALAG
jgi:5,10-methylenetetrahydromethanopterin reductase